MCFWTSVVGVRSNGQERITETSLVQKSGFMKTWGQDYGQKELPSQDCEEHMLIYFRVRKSKGKESFKRVSFAKEDSQDTRGVAIVKSRLFFPLERH